jgi:hypothetical protein
MGPAMKDTVLGPGMPAADVNIRMYGQAVDIQSRWQFTPGDLYWIPGWKTIEMHCPECDIIAGSPDIKTLRCVWIPYQHQLQEFVKGIYRPTTGRLTMPRAFFHWTTDCNTDRKFRTMDELWLGFVMGRRFARFWDGKDWVAENPFLAKRPRGKNNRILI